jgi:hypothetical protein
VAARVESENEGRGKKEEVRKNEEEWGRQPMYITQGCQPLWRPCRTKGCQEGCHPSWSDPGLGTREPALMVPCSCTRVPTTSEGG